MIPHLSTGLGAAGLGKKDGLAGEGVGGPREQLGGVHTPHHLGGGDGGVEEWRGG